MKKYIILFLLLFSFQNCIVLAQLTIEECQEKARKNYPLIKQYSLIDKSEVYNISNANKGYLPQISFSAQTTYQSDVTEFPSNLVQVINQMTGQKVKIPSVNKDQHRMVVELNQLIWDGGVISSQKENINVTTELERQKLEVDLYKIKDRVNNLFFGILVINEQLIQLGLLQKELEINYDKVNAYIQNGIANQSDLDIIRVEQLKTTQKKAELTAIQKSYREMLAVMIGDSMALSDSLVKPDFQVNIDSEIQINRPELKLFDTQSKFYLSQESIIKSGNLPKIGLFIQGGYANPGLNIFESGFTFYYFLGARLTWNFSGFYTQKNNLNKITLNKQIVESQKETFLYNINLQIIQIKNEIKKIKEQIKIDDEIIELRKNIKKVIEAKVENGTLTVTDLIREINAENSAIQEKALREIHLLMAMYNLKNLTNN